MKSMKKERNINRTRKFRKKRIRNKTIVKYWGVGMKERIREVFELDVAVDFAAEVFASGTFSPTRAEEYVKTFNKEAKEAVMEVYCTEYEKVMTEEDLETYKAILDKMKDAQKVIHEALNISLQEHTLYVMGLGMSGEQ